jgi:multisubunit Na+/H+ antiporter MnhB subunit
VRDDPGLIEALVFAGTLVLTALVLRVLAGRPPVRGQTARAYALLTLLAGAAATAVYLLGR